jgi:hypothetical protein
MLATTKDGKKTAISTSLSRMRPGPGVGCVASCALMLISVACSRTPSNFTATDPAKQSDAWALQRADIDCKTQVGSEKWTYRWQLRRSTDPNYVSCMEQKGYARVRTTRGPLWDCNPYQCHTYKFPPA